LHTAQLMPLPLTVSCFSKIQIGLPFWYRLTRVVPDKGPLNGCVYVCVCKDIYIVQDRKGHKCAVSAEMAVWLCNCLCLYSYLHN